ncbi:GNAT family N-acetyltransferase [Flavobacterium sp. K5-23]|uniref:GNAT family N-acetyltransferase n=1 Tax=Flavobacterium sp. K5-23 TaxID=2746225 RepID=UPI0020100C42|nr:GNAT family N-acetyltransferase [Flavobacterium sp. K5-23]UQD56960.1 GNAT family N-acetyltransferase [Flavobacterium sp. K5-23]
MSEVHIAPYDPKYHQEYKNLSIEWLEKYDLLEEADMPMLDHPKEVILDQGGFIFLAHYDNTVVGTIGLIKIEEDCFEILKLGVNERYQGLGIGRKLMVHILELCNQLGAKKIVLETNTKLVSAIKLYKSFGFMEIPLTEALFLTADCKMELNIS